MSVGRSIARLAPGALLCGAVTVLAIASQAAEAAVLGHAYLDAVVLAILIGAAIRTAWVPDPRWRAGIAFSASTLLELAIVLLGASVSVGVIGEAGPALMVGVAGIVAMALAAGYGIGRLLGLPARMAVLIACGNAICGNAAIAAVAPVVGADPEEVTSSIAFTAILGVVFVIALPLLVPVLALGQAPYGIVAGLTVYAVPQVLAATVPVGPLAAEVGALVKLARILCLGPVVVLVALLAPRFGWAARSGARPTLGRLVPWFILGFLGLAAMRSLGFVPDAVSAPATTISRILTVVAMAALGLGVDIRMLAQAGPAVVATVTASLALLVAASLCLVRLLGAW